VVKRLTDFPSLELNNSSSPVLEKPRLQIETPPLPIFLRAMAIFSDQNGERERERDGGKLSGMGERERW